MLKIHHLFKRFNTLVAVDDISFQVQSGEIFGLLGPNGAGKSTTINIICGLVRADSGQVFLDEEEMTPNSTAVKQKLGIVPQDIALYEDLNALDNLKFWGSLYKIPRKQLLSKIQNILELTGLTERAKDKVKTYSGGMKRRLNMAAGLLHNPKLLLLDEPTVGIDPQARHNMLQLVKQIAAQGTTILYTTHYLEEAEDLCDRLAIMDHGKILAMGTQDEIKEIVSENTMVKLAGQFETSQLQEFSKEVNSELVTASETDAVFSIPPSSGTGEFIEKMMNRGWIIQNLQIKEPSLDSVFIKLTGRELRD